MNFRPIMTFQLGERGLARPGNAITRRAPRHSGRGWVAQPFAAGRTYAVRDLSRLGICLEGTAPMRAGELYSTVLRGPAGSSLVRVRVLRCILEHPAAVRPPVYRIGGSFARPLPEGLLPGS